MDTRKFGAYISKLRKQNDWTQSQLADMLNVSRQAVSKWEMGDSLPDIALLPPLADLFHVTIDQILNNGGRCPSESSMMRHLLEGRPEKVADMLHNSELSADSVVHAAPLLKASALGVIAEGLAKHGIDIAHVVELAAYMNEAELTRLLKAASLEKLDGDMLEKFAPFLDEESKEVLFMKLVNKELDGALLETLVPYLDVHKYGSLIEAAVLEGEFDAGILRQLNRMQS